MFFLTLLKKKHSPKTCNLLRQKPKWNKDNKNGFVFLIKTVALRIPPLNQISGVEKKDNCSSASQPIYIHT